MLFKKMLKVIYKLQFILDLHYQALKSKISLFYSFSYNWENNVWNFEAIVGSRKALLRVILFLVKQWEFAV